MGVPKFDCRNLRFQVCIVIAYENISLEITTVSTCEFSTYVNKIPKIVLVNPLTLNVFWDFFSWDWEFPRKSHLCFRSQFRTIKIFLDSKKVSTFQSRSYF